MNAEIYKKQPPLVLVTDDDRQLSSAYRLILEREGYEVNTAANGREAIESCSEQMPDLILMDAMMPVMNGYEATQALISKFGSACAPIVMVTSRCDDESVDQAYEAGVSDYMFKPVNWPVLMHRAKRLIQARVNQGGHSDLQVGHAVIEASRRELSDQIHSIGREANDIAHDFTDILTAIVGYRDLAGRLADDHDEKQLAEYLGEIEKASQRACELAGKIMQFSSETIRKSKFDPD